MEISYFNPKSLEETLALLDDLQKEATSILAGGTDLMPKLNNRNLNIKNIIYIGDLSLNYIKLEGNATHIGATTKLTALLESTIIAEKFPALKQAIERPELTREIV